MELIISKQDAIEADITKGLDRLCQNPKSSSWSDSIWTKNVKSTIAQLGVDRKCNVFGFGDAGEWLYDLI